MDDRTNTIAGWVLFAGIVALGGAIVTGEHFAAERPEKMGYPIEGVSDQPEGGAAAAEQPIETFLASADPVKGEQVFKRCATCHTINKGGPAGVGPNLYGVLGGPVGHMAGFPYTDDLKKIGGERGLGKTKKRGGRTEGGGPGPQKGIARLPQPPDPGHGGLLLQPPKGFAPPQP